MVKGREDCGGNPPLSLLTSPVNDYGSVITDDDKRSLEEERYRLCSSSSSSTSSLSQPSGTTKTRLNMLFARRLARLTRLVILSASMSILTISLAVAVFGVSVANTYAGYLVGLVPSLFYKVLIDRDRGLLSRVLFVSGMYFLAAILCESLLRYLVEYQAVQWRRALTHHLHALYLKGNTFHRVLHLDHRIDNPDQRIVEDTHQFTTLYSSVFAKGIVAPLMITYYSIKTLELLGWRGPVVVFAFFLVGFFINSSLLSPIVHMVFRQEKLEGDLRYTHAVLRTHSESVALQGGAPWEAYRVNDRLERVVRNQEQIVFRHWFLQGSTSFFHYVGSVLNYIIIALVVFSESNQFEGEDSGDVASLISRSSFTCLMLTFSFSQLIDLSKMNLAGFTARVAELEEVLLELVVKEPETQWTPHPPESNVISLKGVCIATPQGRSLVESIPPPCNVVTLIFHDSDFDVTVTVKEGHNLLIQGPSGSGKTSLLRTLCGLWPAASGSIHRPSFLGRGGWFFLPQRPYVFYGRLVDQIHYPLCVQVAEGERREEEELLRIVGLADLPSMGGGWHTMYHWEDVLSPGEQQRLCLARLLYHRPRFAVLDEATSALDLASETRLCNACTQAGITLITVGHGSSLAAHHHTRLLLDGEGGYSIQPIGACVDLISF